MFGTAVTRVSALLPAISFLLFLSGSALGEENTAQTDYSAEITWVTDMPSTSQVEYGEGQGGYTRSTPVDEALIVSHKVTLKNLQPAVPYHYRVRSKDHQGLESISKDFTLTAVDAKVHAPIEISEVTAKSIVAGAIGPASADDAQASKSQPSQAGAMVAKQDPMERTLIQKGGLLLAKSKLQLEPSLTYAHVSANRIAVEGIAILPILVIGEISTENVKRDIFIAASTLRYGLLDDLQLNFKVPYKFQEERVSNSGNTETMRSDSGIGDIETGLLYQFFYEKGAWPGLIAGLNVKSDTGVSPYGRAIGLGTGHWGIKPNLVWVKSSDPAIFFGGIGYTWNMERDINGFGRIDPGDTFEYSLGMAIALNYQVAINFQIEQQITNKMRINDNFVAGSLTNSASFKIGLTYSFSKNTALDVVTSYGLSEDAPDFVLEVRVPYTF